MESSSSSSSSSKLYVHTYVHTHNFSFSSKSPLEISPKKTSSGTQKGGVVYTNVNTNNNVYTFVYTNV